MPVMVPTAVYVPCIIYYNVPIIITRFIWCRLYTSGGYCPETKFEDLCD